MSADCLPPKLQQSWKAGGARLDPGLARMLAVVVASVALYLPATRLRCAPVRLQLQQPNDDLKIGFSRGDDDGPKTSFAPDKRPETAPKKTVNEELMEEIQALMPPEKPAPKEAKPVDLNGIKPRDLLFGLPVGSVALLVPRVAMASEGRLPSGLLAVQRTQDAGRRAAHAPNGRPHDSRSDPAAFTHPGSVRRRTSWCATRRYSSCWARPSTSMRTPSPRPTSTSCRDSPPSRAWWSSAWRPSAAG